ncbi:MAG: hypothetical protein CL843_12070 [Crocinitomicaceae bacterium]|nr:hypothetical protein [Crocinitomicaceae bacterium]
MKNRAMKKALLSLALATGAMFSAKAQTIIYVDADATGSNNGSTWASAYTNLANALDNNGVTGAQIWIAEGTYTPYYSNSSFDIKHGEKLYGGFNGTETSISQRNPAQNITILSGDVYEDDSLGNYYNNAKRIINVDPYDPNNTLNGEEVVLLDGLTISDAYSTSAAGGGLGTDYPGVYQKGIRIYNCIFENNTNRYQSAFNFYTSYSDPVLEVSNSIFRNNHALEAYTVEFRVTNTTGAAYYATFTNNLFENNTTVDSVYTGGGVVGRFANFSFATFEIQLTNNTFIGNSNNNGNFHKCLFVSEKGSSANADIIMDFDNNLFFDNVNLNTIVMDNNAIWTTKYIGANCKNNGGDWTQLNSFVGSLISPNDPFEDYAAGDLRPTTSYATQGDTASYLSTWTDYDLAGEDRMDYVNGTIAIGAYQRGLVCQNTTATINADACLEYTSPSGKIWTAAGTYQDTIPNSCGFDSAMTINLTIIVDTSVSITSGGIELMANQASATYQWYDCDTDLPISGATNQTYQPTQTGDYGVEVTVGNCTEYSECHYVVVTGVNDLKEAANLSIFPNPADDIITVKHELNSNIEVSIYTLTGAQVSNTIVSSNANTIDVSSLPAGYYILKAKSGDLEHVEKLIIQ